MTENNENTSEHQTNNDDHQVQKTQSGFTRWLKRITITLFMLALLAVSSVYVAKLWLDDWSNRPINQLSGQEIVVKSGQSSHHVLSLLANKYQVHQVWAFKVLFKLSPELTHLKAGHYQLPQSVTPINLFQLLASGEEKQFSVTFVEGSTFAQWLDVLKETPYISYQQQRVTEYIASFEASSVNEQKYRYARVEGRFFPETYYFNANTPAVDILKRANDSLNKKLDELWLTRADNIPLANKEQALILASIIEKETGVADEREQISSAFTNRLNKKMRLQTDPTVIYGMADVYDGDITYSHLRDKNVYNTYVIKGLPPTPIAMPSAGAIKAALNPADTPYIYFVASGHGGHVFSTNLRDHNRAIKRYLKTLKSN